MLPGSLPPGQARVGAGWTPTSPRRRPSRVVGPASRRQGGCAGIVVAVAEASKQRKEIVGERRWPMVSAVVVAMVMHEVLPSDFRLAPLWIYPVVMTVFLVLLVAGDPGLIDVEKRWLRVVTGLLIALMALTNLVAAIRLVQGIFDGAAFATDPFQLLGIGAVIWVTNIIAFGLWYWDVDGGGSVQRATRGAWADPAFIFPEMNLPELKPGWFAQFPDHLALSFNTATAFSPTDVSAVRRWAKFIMILESSSSLVLATLVIASAINNLGS